jgi:hypothetical protein
MHCDVCRKAGPDITSKTEFVTGKKKFKRASKNMLLAKLIKIPIRTIQLQYVFIRG